SSSSRNCSTLGPQMRQPTPILPMRQSAGTTSIGGYELVKTQYYVASTLDGYIATEDDSLDWLFPLGSLEDSSYPRFIADIGAIAMGSASYEWILRNADTVAAETGSAWPYTQPT